MEYKINAEGKILGRLATEVAMLLRAKNDPKFSPEKFFNNTVTVYNTDKVRVTGKKINQKIYYRHSGYHGGLKEELFKDMLVRDSRLILRHAVLGMLPKNKLRPRMIKNLILFKKEGK